MTPEQKQRVEQIRERHQRADCYKSQMRADINFLLSLVKEQEATTREGRLEAQLQGIMNSLAISQQEVERLREGRFTPEELQSLCHNLNGDDKAAFFDGCSRYQEQLFGVSAATAMRSACVEKVKAYLTDCREEERGIIEAIASELEALSIEKSGEEQK